MSSGATSVKDKYKNMINTDQRPTMVRFIRNNRYIGPQ